MNVVNIVGAIVMPTCLETDNVPITVLLFLSECADLVANTVIGAPIVKPKPKPAIIENINNGVLESVKKAKPTYPIMLMILAITNANIGPFLSTIFPPIDARIPEANAKGVIQ